MSRTAGARRAPGRRFPEQRDRGVEVSPLRLQHPQVVVSLAIGRAAPRIGQPVALFADRFLLTTARDMDLSRDGRRLLMLAEVEPAKLDFFEHWFDLSPAAPR